MKKYKFKFIFIVLVLSFMSACTTSSITNSYFEPSSSDETLYVYEDGRMALNARFVNAEDVVIYADGRGGEKAAVKVHVPIHAAFYRDSIVVVRVVNKLDEALSQNENDDLNNIN